MLCAFMIKSMFFAGILLDAPNISTHMRKKDCIRTLNEIMEFLVDHECFESIYKELDLDEEELEIVLQSVITDIDNDDCSCK